MGRLQGLPTPLSRAHGAGPRRPTVHPLHPLYAIHLLYAIHPLYTLHPIH
ncbi:hypothetical protein ACWEL8_01300 [Streptomyces sp. NPDC004690]